MNNFEKTDETLSRNGTIPKNGGDSRPKIGVHYLENVDQQPDADQTSDQQDSQRGPRLTRLQSNASVGGKFPLYEEDTSSNMLPLGVYLRSLAGIDTSSGDEMGAHGKKGAKLGTLFGVYLPSIQHILGVQMFLRLLWIVGIAGFAQSFSMLLLCCICTLLTSISISAIATNGVIDSGGAYFMISRNLGPEFGGAIGILFYLANTVATAMYLVGGVEILLMYMAPGLPKFASPEPHEPNFNNFRIYGTLFLIVLFGACALGIRFVQFFAPISLAMVILSILSVFIGGFVASPSDAAKVCLMGDVLLKPEAFTDANGTTYCNKSMNSPLWNIYCHETGNDSVNCDPYFEEHNVRFAPAIPGFSSGVINENLWSSYMESGQSIPGRQGKHHSEVSQDISTTFFVLLAIFFPSVTGIMTGANMSGDLKDPQKSIPIGTIAATLTTSFIYLTLVVVYSGTIIGPLLRDKYGESIGNTMVVAALAWPDKWLLLVGSFTACMGAGLQCLCTSPRILQSVAKDNLLPFLSPFSVMTKRHEPIRALILTVIIAEGAILIGGIDNIAPVVDFFFLTSYCFVNVACALQTLLKAPNWRPRFKFYHWSLAVLGALLNLFIMFSTFWYYALFVLIMCAALYKYIEFKGAKKEWGDGMRGLALSTAQYSLLRVEEAMKQHPKNWRPQLLLLLKLKETEELQNRKMLHLANQLKAGRGLTMVASLLQGDLTNPEDRKRAAEAKLKLQTAMQESKVKGFTEVPLCENLSDNVGTVIQCVGMGGLRPNTVLLGWPYNWRKTFYNSETHYSSILDAVHRATAADMCLLVAKGLHMFPDAKDQLVGFIDVWWIIHDGGLLILLPFLLRQHKVWRQCVLRIFAVAQFDDNTIKMKEDLQNLVYQLRIEAQIYVVELSDSIVAPYTYERTMLMEERAQLAMNLHLTNEELAHEPQLLADRYRNESTAELFHRASTRRGRRDTSPPPSTKLGVTQAVSNAENGGESALPLDGKSPTQLRGSAARGDSGGQHNRAFNGRDVVVNVEGGATIAGVGSVDEESDGDVLDDDTFFGGGEPDSRKVSEGSNDRLFHVGSDPDSIGNAFSSLRTEKLRLRRQKMAADGRKISRCSGDVDPDRIAGLDKKKVRKMNMAIRMNKAIHEKSSTSRLVILNLPKPPRSKANMDQYMEYLEVLTENLERVLLVRGCGKEVITIYS